MDILVMQTSRDAYSKEDAAKNSLTVGDNGSGAQVADSSVRRE